MRATIEQIEAAILDPNFSHTRAGEGCWRDVRWIYHVNSASPSGVVLVMSGDKSIVEPMLLRLRKGGPLSPTENR